MNTLSNARVHATRYSMIMLFKTISTRACDATECVRAETIQHTITYARARARWNRRVIFISSITFWSHGSRNGMKTGYASSNLYLRPQKSIRFLVSASDPCVGILVFLFFCYETMSNCSQHCAQRPHCSISDNKVSCMTTRRHGNPIQLSDPNEADKIRI